MKKIKHESFETNHNGLKTTIQTINCLDKHKDTWSVELSSNDRKVTVSILAETHEDAVYIADCLAWHSIGYNIV